MIKPNLKDVLHRRKRTLEQFFIDKIESGMSKDNILIDVSVAYSLSDDAIRLLEKLVAKNEQETKKAIEEAIDTKADETIMSDDNVTTTESQEESKPEVVAEENTTPTKRKNKRKNSKLNQDNADDEEQDSIDRNEEE